MIRDLFEQKPELKKIILIALIAIILLIILITIFSSSNSQKITYEQLENKMKEAATNYYKTNKDKLPKNGNSITISYNTLVESGNIEKMDKYLENSNMCTGKVTVKNINDKYIYTPYLDCGDDYKAIEFYSKVLDDNEIVSDKSGLYLQNGSKVFRGENINNFVSIGNHLWRIVKIDSDNTVKLILYSGKIRTTWDNRYNSDKNSSTGKNIYSLSRLKETIDNLYNDETFLSDTIKSKLVSKPLCIGSRSISDNINDGSIECSQTLEGEYIGNLSLYEYINASLDAACISADNNECQNYNYLIESETNFAWWLVTSVKDNSYQAYYVESQGSINTNNCSSYLYIRPTIYLGTDVLYSSGKGTLDNPYKIR